MLVSVPSRVHQPIIFFLYFSAVTCTVDSNSNDFHYSTFLGFPGDPQTLSGWTLTYVRCNLQGCP